MPKVDLTKSTSYLVCHDCTIPLYSYQGMKEQQSHNTRCSTAHIVGHRNDPSHFHLCTECWMLRYSKVWIGNDNGDVGLVDYRVFKEDCVTQGKVTKADIRSVVKSKVAA